MRIAQSPNYRFTVVRDSLYVPLTTGDNPLTRNLAVIGVGLYVAVSIIAKALTL